MKSKERIQFDRELKLYDVFSTREVERIKTALSRLFNCYVDVVEPESQPEPESIREPILWELEPVAYLQAKDMSCEQLRGAADIFLIMLKEAVRYRMASDIHLETVLEDYAALQEKHAALQKSEHEYRLLCEELEQKVAEQVRDIDEAHVKIYQSEKLASVGQLAAGVAHELNTPLEYIKNNLSAAKEYFDDMNKFHQLVLQGADRAALMEGWAKAEMDFLLDDFPNLLNDSLDGVKRAASIIDDLKLFSDLNRQNQREEDINKRISNVLELITPHLGKKQEIQFEPGDLPSVTCYPAHLGQVFYNLLQNSVEAVGEEGTIFVRSGIVDDQICVTISDTGPGISEDNLSRIFDPFFTTKEVGSGTGLGLSVVSDVIKAHKGVVEVESALGKETIFRVFLPINL